jgi:hypothetical protein
LLEAIRDMIESWQNASLRQSGLLLQIHMRRRSSAAGRSSSVPAVLFSQDSESDLSSSTGKRVMLALSAFTFD